MCSIALLCSGGLGAEILKRIAADHQLKAVCTDSKSIPIIDFCEENSIPLFVGNPRKLKGSQFLNTYEFDYLLSVNYLFLIEEDMLKLSSKLTFNIHGSLLPKYRGRTPHVWAIINNETMTGITAHIIDQGCDTGAILEQIKIPIEENDTGNDVLLKYNKAYYPLIERTLQKSESGLLTKTEQEEKCATYYGKRTPQDGRINWQWTKERIRNWVRAQSNPYPGAFTSYNNEMVVVDVVQFSNIGYHYNDANGTILSVNPLTIKCCNGAVELTECRPHNITLKIGNILS